MAARLCWSDAHTADQEREVHALLAADLAFREESS
jgi:hypothetical protein